MWCFIMHNIDLVTVCYLKKGYKIAHVLQDIEI